MSARIQIIRDVFHYSTSGIVTQALGLISGIWIARLLGPSDFGIWNAVSLVLVYGAYMEFGALSAMSRDLPFYYGQGDVEKAASVEGAARRTTILGALIGALIVLLFSLIPIHSPKMTYGLQAMAVILILQQVYTYHRMVLRSNNCFTELSQQQVLLAIVTAGLAVLFALFYGYYGRLLAAILAQAAIVYYALRRNPWKPVPKFNLSVTWSIMRVGLPILISGFIITLLTTINRLMTITFLGETQLGYFGLGLLLTSIVSLIPAAASQVLYPRINYRFGSTGRNIGALRSYVLIPPVILSSFLPLIIGPLYLTLPFVVKIFLPAYTPGITAASIVVVGIFFYGILGLTDYLLVTIGKLKQYAIFGIIAIVFNIVLNFMFIHLGYGIEGIAVSGILLTYLFYSCIIIGYALSHYTKRLGDWIRYFAKLWLPFIYMIVLLWVADIVVNHMMVTTSNIHLFFSTLAKLSLFGVCYIPLLYLVFKKQKLDFSKLNLICD